MNPNSLKEPAVEGAVTELGSEPLGEQMRGCSKIPQDEAKELNEGEQEKALEVRLLNWSKTPLTEKTKQKLSQSLPQVRMRYHQLMSDYEHMGQLILKLMAHPHTTEQELLGARHSYMKVSEWLKLMRKQLQVIYPSTSYVIDHPWHKDKPWG